MYLDYTTIITEAAQQQGLTDLTFQQDATISRTEYPQERTLATYPQAKFQMVTNAPPIYAKTKNQHPERQKAEPTLYALYQTGHRDGETMKYILLGPVSMG